MIRHMNKLKSSIVFSAIVLLMLSGFSTADAQDIRWMRIGELQSFFSETGVENEGFIPTGNNNFFSWPAQFSIDQNTVRGRALWIGARNYFDPIEGRQKQVKVVGAGPRDFEDRRNQVMPQEIRLIGRSEAPLVTVDENPASDLGFYDELDEIDESLPSDRMIHIRFNTSIGITVDKKIYAFANSEHDNYFIYEYEFTNTGIYNRAGDVHEQTLEQLWFYLLNRYAFAGVSSSGFGSTWGAFSSVWGASTLNHAFGQNPNVPDYTDNSGASMRGYYSYYGPHPESNNSQLSYDEDWGCPEAVVGDRSGMMASAKYAGMVVLHADAGPTNPSNDPSQPRTTHYVGSDLQIMQAGSMSQFNEIQMEQRYQLMTMGHSAQQHDEAVGDGNYPNTFTNPPNPKNAMGFGPYTLAPGQTIRIVLAEGVAGVSWERGRVIGRNWLQWRSGDGQPTLTLPDGSTTNDHNQYKREWVQTGRDSLLNTLRKAIDNYESGFSLPEPPPPPARFTVLSGGDRIALEWDDNASSHPNFSGYVIYRSRGNVLDYRTIYERIYPRDDASIECSNGICQFDDVTAARGFDYFYYVQSHDDGTQVPGTTLYSSLFWTLTSEPASLQRPAGDFLYEVRVVPNPYDIRGRIHQFGHESQYDQIAFYGLPPQARLRIYTERGDLIWEREHTDNTGDERWDSRTRYGQIVASGVYILHVEVTEEIHAEEDKFARWDIYDDKMNLRYRTGDLLYSEGDLIYRKGQTTFRKFVIIR
jgi:hypothetical protein